MVASPCDNYVMLSDALFYSLNPMGPGIVILLYAHDIVEEKSIDGVKKLGHPVYSGGQLTRAATNDYFNSRLITDFFS